MMTGHRPPKELPEKLMADIKAWLAEKPASVENVTEIFNLYDRATALLIEVANEMESE